MEIQELVEWHKLRAEEVSRRMRIHGKTRELVDERSFHVQASLLAISFSKLDQERRLMEVEIDVKRRSVESLEHLSRLLLSEAKSIRQMLSGEVSGD